MCATDRLVSSFLATRTKHLGMACAKTWTMDWTMDDGRWTMDDGRWTMDVHRPGFST